MVWILSEGTAGTDIKQYIDIIYGAGRYHDKGVSRPEGFPVTRTVWGLGGLAVDGDGIGAALTH